MQNEMSPSEYHDIIFILSAVILNISISVIYISTKLDLTALQQTFGFVVISLIIPFTVTFREYLKKEAGLKISISNMIIIAYLLLELVLDYVLKIPFRDILGIHIPYIILFYAAEFSIIHISFHTSRKTGYIVSITFCLLIGCLIYLYLG